MVKLCTLVDWIQHGLRKPLDIFLRYRELKIRFSLSFQDLCGMGGAAFCCLELLEMEIPLEVQIRFLKYVVCTVRAEDNDGTRTREERENRMMTRAEEIKFSDRDLIIDLINLCRTFQSLQQAQEELRRLEQIQREELRRLEQIQREELRRLEQREEQKELILLRQSVNNMHPSQSKDARKATSSTLSIHCSTSHNTSKRSSRSGGRGIPNSHAHFLDRSELANSLNMQMYLHGTKLEEVDTFEEIVTNRHPLNANEFKTAVADCYDIPLIAKGKLRLHKVKVDQGRLRAVGEPKYQKEFQMQNETNKKIILTSDKNLDTPFFKGPHRDGYFTKTAKVDVVMKSFPAGFEFKHLDVLSTAPANDNKITNSDKAVLDQALERIMTVALMNAFIKVMAMFAVTGNRCYIMLFTRKWNDSSSRFEERIDTYKVTIEAICDIWAHLSYLGSESSSSYLTDDAIPILHTINKLGYQPQYCRTRLIASSKARIYGVRLPEFTGGVMRISREDYHFTIKVTSSRNITNEIKLLKHIGSQIPSIKESIMPGSDFANFDFYALGYVSGDELEWFVKDHKSHLPPKTSVNGYCKSSVWWIPTYCEDAQQACQTIFMKYGSLTVPSISTRSEFIKGVENSLYFYHRAQVVHRDIRLDNVVKFGEKWQLIDLDHGARFDEERDLHEEDNQFKCAGASVHSTKKRRKHNWTAGDDYSMLIALYDFILNPNIVDINSGNNEKIEDLINMMDMIQEFDNDDGDDQTRNICIPGPDDESMLGHQDQNMLDREVEYEDVETNVTHSRKRPNSHCDDRNQKKKAKNNKRSAKQIATEDHQSGQQELRRSTRKKDNRSGKERKSKDENPSEADPEVAGDPSPSLNNEDCHRNEVLDRGQKRLRTEE